MIKPAAYEDLTYQKIVDAAAYYDKHICKLLKDGHTVYAFFDLDTNKFTYVYSWPSALGIPTANYYSYYLA